MIYWVRKNEGFPDRHAKPFAGLFFFVYDVTKGLFQKFSPFIGTRMLSFTLSQNDHESAICNTSFAGSSLQKNFYYRFQSKINFLSFTDLTLSRAL